MSYADYTDYGTYEDEGISAIVLGETRPVAKVTHTCTLCSATISPGQRYHRYRLIVDGDPMVQKQCQRCDEIELGG